MKKQAHILYTGMVQGVGFRYTVRECAVNLGLAGWVRNRNDGRVEVLVEGQLEAIHQLIARIERNFESYIQEKEINYQESAGLTGEFKITPTA